MDGFNVVMSATNDLSDFLQWFVAIVLVGFSIAFVDQKNRGAAWILAIILILSILIRDEVRSRLVSFGYMVFAQNSGNNNSRR